MVLCPRCRFQNFPQARSCLSCGRKLEPQSQADPDLLETKPPTSASAPASGPGAAEDEGGGSFSAFAMALENAFGDEEADDDDPPLPELEEDAPEYGDGAKTTRLQRSPSFGGSLAYADFDLLPPPSPPALPQRPPAPAARPPAARPPAARPPEPRLAPAWPALPPAAPPVAAPPAAAQAPAALAPARPAAPVAEAEPEPEVAQGQRIESRPEQVVAWLICEGFDPVPLARDRAQVVIGRSQRSDLCLPHESVSRAHVAIRVLGESMNVEDRSTYGTHLNGARIRSAKLRVGDELQVGPYRIGVWATLPSDKPEDEEEITRPLQLPETGAEAMKGRLERISLPEVLQQIEFNQKTGTLRVFDEAGKESLLVVYEGAPVYAEGAPGQKDQDVVFEMLRLTRGQFNFMSQVEAGEMRMVGVTLTGLLLEFSRQVDEDD